MVVMKRKVELRNNKNATMLLIFIAELAAGFVFSGTKMSGASTFADISIAGASGLSGCAAVFMGSLLYSFLSGTIGRNIVKLAAMVLLLIAKLLMENKRDPRSCGIFTSVCVFLAGTAVGMTAVSMPIAEIIGRATVREHLPKQEISCIETTFFIYIILS